jgi:hypothetical protein
MAKKKAKVPAATPAAAPSKFLPARKAKAVDVNDDAAVAAHVVNALSALSADGVVKKGQISLVLTNVMKLTKNATEVAALLDNAMANNAIKGA